MATRRESHLYYGRTATVPATPRDAERTEAQRRLERGLTAPPGARGLDFPTYRELAAAASRNVEACATVGRVTRRAPADLRKLQERIEYHEANGTLRGYVLDHPDEVVAALCGSTKRALSILISVLDEPRVAYLQTLKNLLIADMKPSSRTGAYLDLYNAITELMCASYTYLSATSPHAEPSPVTQVDLCRQVHARAEKFYTVLASILAGAYAEDEVLERPASGPAVITEATMRTRRQSLERDPLV